jgi:cob(I)alamin adenosyltransferase
MPGAMKIYTKTGDAGSTGLFGGARVDKDDARVEAYGTVDETNAAIGMARAAKPPEAVERVLAEVQADLFVLGAELACVAGKEDKLRMRLLAATDIARLEQAIDASETTLAPLTSFVLPGGTPAAAALHHARTVCRRAERRVLAAGRQSPVRADVLIYLNRLSDLLFVLARRANREAGIADQPWQPSGE